MRVGAKTDYAVRAVVALARAQPSFVKAQVIAANTAVPLEFLENILRELRRAGLVTALRGADGGYCLSVDAGDLTVAAVVRAVDGHLAVATVATNAVTGHDVVGRLWSEVGAITQRALEAVTIADLSGDVAPA